MYAGNEGQVEKFYENSGFLVDELSKEFKALIVFPEHWYFGKSWPFRDKEKSFAKDKVKFLTIEQVMEDYNLLAKLLYEKYKKQVILFGGSYGGMLAAWLWMKFPTTFKGAVSSSAPIL